MPLNLKSEIKKGGCYVLVLPNKEYSRMILETTKYLSSNYPRVCYVSLNRMYSTLAESLSRAKINTNNFLFIDALTQAATTKKPKESNCIYINSVAALTELGIAISGALKTGKFDAILFDSLSTLLIYNKSTVVGEFTHSLINKIRALNVTAVFTALEEDTESELLKKIGMSVDGIVHC